MNNVFKNVVKNTVGALAIAGVMAVVQAQSASALSLNFRPTGSQLDGDGVRDIQTSVGSVINFDLVLNTQGLAPNETIKTVEYLLDWDTTELGLIFPTPFTPPGEIAGGVVDFTNPDPLNVFATYGVSQTLATAIGADVTKTIGTISFKVLSGLNNSGNADFYLTYLFPDGFGVEGSQTQSVEVQPVPTPALLPGLFALGATAIRKRKQQAAAV
jgi:hypothetical protein